MNGKNTLRTKATGGKKVLSLYGYISSILLHAQAYQSCNTVATHMH